MKTIINEMKRFFQFVKKHFKERPIVNYAAQMSYGALLAFTPLIMLLYNILSFFASDLNGTLIEELERILPSVLAPLVKTAALSAHLPYTSVWSNIIYAFFIIYFSVYVLRLFLLTNTKVMGIKETRNPVKSYLDSIGYLFLVLLMVFILVGVMLILRRLLVAVFVQIGIYGFISNYWQSFSQFVITMILVIMLTVLYMLSPPKRMPFVTALPGGIFGGISWLIVNTFSGRILERVFDTTTLTSSFEWPFIVVLTIFLACFLLVFGMLINMYFLETGRTTYDGVMIEPKKGLKIIRVEPRKVIQFRQKVISKAKGPLDRIKPLITAVFTDIFETDFFGVCYQTAFYLLMTFFPLAIFLINFVGSIVSNFEMLMYDFLGQFLPNIVFRYVTELIESLKINVGSNSFVLLVLAFFFASLLTRTVYLGLSQNYRNPRPRRSKRIWVFAISITFLFALSLIIVILSYFILNTVVVNIFSGLGSDQWLISCTVGFSYIFMIISVLAGLAILYTLTSPPEMKMKYNVPGAIVAFVIFVVFFRIYLFVANHSIRYTLFYGKLGGFFLFMVVIYFSCVIINIGCKFNLFLYCYRHRDGILF